MKEIYGIIPGRAEGVSHCEIIEIIEKSVIFINKDKKIFCDRLIKIFDFTTTPEKLANFFNMDSDEIIQGVIEGKIIGFFKYYGKNKFYIVTGSMVNFLNKKGYYYI